jgi:hypothetical protein
VVKVPLDALNEELDIFWPKHPQNMNKNLTNPPALAG